MKKSGAALVAFALEQIGVKFTFGIPGVHNTEIYDALNSSSEIEPILVTHELSAAFMADAVSRTSRSIGTLLIVPAAGTTHAMSGIGEAFLDGIPMLVITGGIRSDSGRAYQLHQLNQENLVREVTKGTFVVKDHASIIPAIYRAYELAASGTPGPVLVEIPAQLQMFQGEIDAMPGFRPGRERKPPAQADLEAAMDLLRNARNPGIYLGWGAHDATDAAIRIADGLIAPVATTLQGLSVFPANHPFHTGMGFGKFSVPAAEKAFERCDCLLAVGVRFGELATGSYSLPVPENLIHSDINPDVFNRNYPAKVTLTGDARDVLAGILGELERSLKKGWAPDRSAGELSSLIRKEKERYRETWLRSSGKDRVNPAVFFTALRERLSEDAIVAVDDGNHTFLTEELFPVYRSGGFISPTDFNAMGYAVPAAIGAKIAHPEKQVVAIAGDGAFLMTGLEILTATSRNAGITVFVFHDGELAQISQFQQIPLNRKTCTVMGDMRLEGIAAATGAHFLAMNRNEDASPVIEEALSISRGGRPVIVDVKIDYSRKTRFTHGVVKANLARFPLGEKFRFIGRAVGRHLFG